jgi:septation ring formation regulator EzrA
MRTTVQQRVNVRVRAENTIDHIDDKFEITPQEVLDILLDFAELLYKEEKKTEKVNSHA